MSTGEEDQKDSKSVPGPDRRTACDEGAPGSLPCPEVTALLYDYMDGVIDPSLRARIEDHLAHGSCECRRALLMELAFDEHVRDCVCGRTAPASLRRRIRELLAG